MNRSSVRRIVGSGAAAAVLMTLTVAGVGHAGSAPQARTAPAAFVATAPAAAAPTVAACGSKCHDRDDDYGYGGRRGYYKSKYYRGEPYGYMGDRRQSYWRGWTDGILEGSAYGYAFGSRYTSASYGGGGAFTGGFGQPIGGGFNQFGGSGFNQPFGGGFNQFGGTGFNQPFGTGGFTQPFGTGGFTQPFTSGYGTGTYIP
ncbi:MAG: hypothetical protein ACT4QG_01965 [Sporichthyaceae bacterium]